MVIKCTHSGTILAHALSSISYLKNRPDLQKKKIYWTYNKGMLRVPLQFFFETFLFR